MRKWVHIFPMIEDIRLDYFALRESKTRKEVVAWIKETYAKELQDAEDMVVAMIGLAVALGKKKELTEEIADQTICAIADAHKNAVLDDVTSQFYNDASAYLREPSLYGSEKPLRQKTSYVPNWEKGDTFYHTLTYPTAKYLGIMGWSIIMHCIGQYTDYTGKQIQLVYISLCEPGKEPRSEADMEKLCFMPMMCMGAKWDYLAQLDITSKRKENAYELTKLGYFPNIPLPPNRTDEDPRTSMPLWSWKRKDDPWPMYEEQICRIYTGVMKKMQSSKA